MKHVCRIATLVGISGILLVSDAFGRQGSNPDDGLCAPGCPPGCWSACFTCIGDPGCVEGSDCGDNGDGENGGDTGKDASDPVKLRSGDYQLQETDLVVPGVGIDFRFKRTYRSKTGYDDRTFKYNNNQQNPTLPPPRGPIGRNWDHSYNLYITRRSDTTWLFHDGTGRVDPFTADSVLRGYSNPYNPQYGASFSAAPGPVSNPPAEVNLEQGDGTTFTFLLAYGYKIGSISDRNGNTLTFEYYSGTGMPWEGKLKRVVDTVQRHINFSYNSNGWLSQVTDPFGRTISFTYYTGDEGGAEEVGNLGDLASVTIDTPESNSVVPPRVWTYLYDEGMWAHETNLREIWDPRGLRILKNHYTPTNYDETHPKRAYDAVIQQEYGDGVYDYLYLDAPNSQCTSYYMHAPTVVINRGGMVKVFRYSGDALVERHDYTGVIDLAVNGVTLTRSDFLEAVWEEWDYWEDVPFPGPRCETWVEVDSKIKELLAPTRLRSDDPASFKTAYTYVGSTGKLDIAALPYSSGSSGDQINKDYNDGFLEPKATGRLEAVTRTPKSGTGSAITERWCYDPLPSGVCGPGSPPPGGGGCGCSGQHATAHITGITSSDQRGKRTEFCFDEHGNRTRIWHGVTYSSGTACTVSGTRAYLADESFEYFTEENSEEFEDMPLGAVRSHTHPSYDGTNTRTDSYLYYETNWVNPSDSTDTGSRGKVKEMIVDAGAGRLNLRTEYAYDRYGNLAKVTEYRSSTETVVRSMTHDGFGQLRTEVAYEVNSTSVETSRRAMSYDNVGNLVREDVTNYTLPGAAASGTGNDVLTTTHDYDVLSRLIGTVKEISGAVVASNQLSTNSPADLRIDAAFVYTRRGYDANDNLSLIGHGESAPTSGSQPNNTVTRVYDERDLLFLETSGGSTNIAATTRFDYDDNGMIKKRTVGLKAGAGAWPEFDTSGSAATLFEHDGHERLTKVTDPKGNTHEFEYDSFSNTVKEWRKGELVDDEQGGDGGLYLSYALRAYDAMNRVTEERRLNRSTPTTGVPNIAGASPPDPFVRRQYAYLPNSALLQATDPLSNQTAYAYDSAHRVKRLTDQRSNTVEYIYDQQSNLASVTETEYSDADPYPAGTPQVFVRTFAYDALSRRASTTDGMGNVIRRQYDSRGNLIAAIDARNNGTRYRYDGLNRLVMTIHDLCPGGQNCNTSLYTLAQYEEAEGSSDIVTQQVWDRSSRLVAQLDSARPGAPVGYEGNRTSYWYDELDRPIITRMADGTMHLVGTGSVTWSPPAAPVISGWTPGYDSRGNPITLLDASISAVSSTFDLNDRVTGRLITLGSGVVGSAGGTRGAEAESYTYDGLSRVKSAQDEDTKVERSYDTLGRLASETSSLATWNGAAWGTFGQAKAVSYSYDAAGNLTALTYPDSVRTVAQEFDNLNRLSKLRDGVAGPVIAEYRYAGPGRVAERIHGNGTQISYGWSGYQGGPAGPAFKQVVSTRSWYTAQPTSTIDHRTIAWDAAQNKTAITPNAQTPSPARSFAYDSANRMTASNYATYVLDGVHNRKNVSGSLDSGAQLGKYTMNSGLGLPAQPEKDLEVNQYSKTPYEHIAYDDNGNLVRFLPQGGGGLLMAAGIEPGTPGGAKELAIDANLAAGDVYGDLTADESFDSEDAGIFGEMLMGGPPPGSIGILRIASLRYDYRNQMVEYEDEDLGRVHRYAYDCFGRRVLKITDHNCVAFATVEKRHVYGGQASWQVLAEYSSTPPCPCGGSEEPACPSHSLAATYVYGNYIDEPIAMRRDVEAPAGVEDYYFHQDDLFNVVALTRGSDGTIVERVNYGDYGFPTVTDATGNSIGTDSTIGNPFLFTGREWEPEIRFFYYRTRYMEPTLGRFTTRDWIGIWGDRSGHGNGLAFVGSRSWAGTDPFGLAFDPLTSPVAPAPLDFRDGENGPSGTPLRFTQRQKDMLQRGMQAACNRAQCALRGLNDPDARKATGKDCASSQVPLDTLEDRLRKFLQRYCNGNSGGKPLPVQPYIDPRHDDQSPQNDPQTMPADDDRPVQYPIVPGRWDMPYRDIPTDLIHEPFHRLFDTPDDDGWFGRNPGNNQHNIDKSIQSACRHAKNRGKYPGDRETDYKPDELNPANRRK